MNAAFTALSLDPDLDHCACDADATRVRAWCGSELELGPEGTHFLYAIGGDSSLRTPTGQFPLRAGMYASVLAGVVEGSGAGLVVSRVGAPGWFQLGGPIEAIGRLRYIDGCTDSLLLAPPLRGDPCLNHLHIPAHTSQTRHMHPSLRVGVIARGRGRCVTPDREHPLEAGLVFVIAPHAVHSFFTDESSLDVVVYHPDSDTGPTHDDHPMINRTLITKG